MVRLAAKQRAMLADKLLDLANYAAAAMVFGQFVGQQPFSWTVMVAGVATWLLLALMSLLTTGGGR